MLRQMDEMIYEMASEPMNESIEEQPKHSNLTLDFDDFVETLPIYTIPHLPKVWFGVVRNVFSYADRADTNRVTFTGSYS